MLEFVFKFKSEKSFFISFFFVFLLKLLYYLIDFRLSNNRYPFTKNNKKIKNHSKQYLTNNKIRLSLKSGTVPAEPEYRLKSGIHRNRNAVFSIKKTVY
jgi:hypothetical protein